MSYSSIWLGVEQLRGHWYSLCAFLLFGVLECPEGYTKVDTSHAGQKPDDVDRPRTWQIRRTRRFSRQEEFFVKLSCQMLPLQRQKCPIYSCERRRGVDPCGCPTYLLPWCISAVSSCCGGCTSRMCCEMRGHWKRELQRNLNTHPSSKSAFRDLET